MSQPEVYYAVPIRGTKGKDASLEYMAENCARAKRNLDTLQVVFPDIRWVSVAPYDRIVQKLLARGLVGIEDVLQADFEVGDACDGLLAHLWEPSNGADQEFDRQSDQGKICVRIHPEHWQIWRADMDVLEGFVKDVLKRKYSCFC